MNLKVGGEKGYLSVKVISHCGDRQSGTENAFPETHLEVGTIEDAIGIDDNETDIPLEKSSIPKLIQQLAGSKRDTLHL